MQYTCIIRAWSHENKMFVQRYVCLLGVKGYGKELLEGDSITKKFAKGLKSVTKMSHSPALMMEIKVLELFSWFAVFILSKQNSHYLGKCISNTFWINQ